MNLAHGAEPCDSSLGPRRAAAASPLRHARAPRRGMLGHNAAILLWVDCADGWPRHGPSAPQHMWLRGRFLHGLAPAPAPPLPLCLGNAACRRSGCSDLLLADQLRTRWAHSGSSLPMRLVLRSATGWHMPIVAPIWCAAPLLARLEGNDLYASVLFVAADLREGLVRGAYGQRTHKMC